MSGPRFAALRALVAGILTVTRSLRLVGLVYAIGIAVVAPLAFALAAALQSQIASSPLADPDAGQFPLAAWDVIARDAGGLTATFVPSILGFGASITTLSAIADATPLPPMVLAVVAVYAASWTLLWGGVLDTFACGWHGWRVFLAACRRSTPPLIRLAIVTLGLYAVLFGAVHPLLFAMRDSSAEMSELTAVSIRLGQYIVFGLLLAMCSLLIDYARVRTVVDASGVFDALAWSWRFTRTHAGIVVVLAMSCAALSAAAFGGYAAFELQTRGAPRAWPAIAAGQLYILARIVARLVTAAAQVKLTRLIPDS